MRFFNAYVRGNCVEPVSDAALEALAALLVQQPAEVVLTSQGARRGYERLAGGQAAAAALARRNVHSVLARGTSIAEVVAGLRAALAMSPRDAEDALEDAGLEFNLRYSIYATPDATLRIENQVLVVADENDPVVEIPRIELRERGARYFGPEALARLVSLEVTAVRFSESAIQPPALQREAGAIMQPDTAHERLHKGEWRATRIPHFAKEYCITCGRCFIHCPDNAIMHAMFDKASKDTTGVLGIDYDRCTACGICASVCPTDRNGYKSIVMVETEQDATAEVHHVA
ncbi:MAG: hypothetical protein AMXMBFR13_17330 [Phycisphaerae bacterium]|jgi:pyruvate ferredoxin oxidoreductase delta subunit